MPVPDRNPFFYLGELIEYDKRSKVFGNPSKEQTEDYVIASDRIKIYVISYIKIYDSDLRDLKDSVIKMGSAALSALEKAVEGLLEGDRDKCYDVIDGGEAINAQEKIIDEQGMSILLRFNPVASDLRQVVASINICRSLERISDHTVTVATRSREILKSGNLII